MGHPSTAIRATAHLSTAATIATAHRNMAASTIPLPQAATQEDMEGQEGTLVKAVMVAMVASSTAASLSMAAVTQVKDTARAAAIRDVLT